MSLITSRRNGLKIAIPSDARGIVHRFAIAGGGNELVFDPIRRSTYSKSMAESDEEMELDAGGASARATAAESAQTEKTVELSENVIEDEAPAKKPARRPARRATTKTETAKAETEAADVEI